LIKLAGVACELAGTRIGEDHRPGHIGNPAPKLAIVKVGKAAQQHTHRHARRDVVAHPQEVEVVAPGHKDDRQHNACKAAVKAHASIPHAKKLPADKTIAGEISEGGRDPGITAGIERSVAQTPAKDHTKRTVEK
jgi:hypothetical protein